MEGNSKKVPCKNENCPKMILEATAEKTGGYCYPCYNAIEAEKREEYIRKNRRDVNLYEGINDPVEILKIMHSHKQYDPLIRYIEYPQSKEEMYDMLSKDDAERLKDYAIGLYNDENDEYEQILLHLMCLKNIELNDFLKVLINDGNIHESSLFKNASDEIAELLIEKLNDNENRLIINHILLCLAMIGNERVVKLFDSWKKNEPEFAEKLYCKPFNYSYEGGWMIDENGNRKNLYYEKSYGVKKGTVPDNTPVNFYVDKDNKFESSAKLDKEELNTNRYTDKELVDNLCTENDESNSNKENLNCKNKECATSNRCIDDNKCGWCGRNLTSLFTIDLHNEDMKFLGFEGDKLNISTCIDCVCYDNVYTDIDTDGNAYWSRYNAEADNSDDYEEDEELEECEDNKLYLDINAKSDNYASNQFLDVRFTKIGGMPAWIQDSAYPKCPQCGEEMKFIGQVSGEDIRDYAEGIYYGFVCKKCMIAATSYQQT